MALCAVMAQARNDLKKLFTLIGNGDSKHRSIKYYAHPWKARNRLMLKTRVKKIDLSELWKTCVKEIIVEATKSAWSLSLLALILKKSRDTKIRFGAQVRY
jgi:hypothetical protein